MAADLSGDEAREARRLSRGTLDLGIDAHSPRTPAKSRRYRTGDLYSQPEPDYFNGYGRETRARAISQLEARGFTVTVEPTEQNRLALIYVDVKKIGRRGPGG